MKMFLISDNTDTYTGMRLAGVEGVVVHGKDELQAARDRVLADKFGRDFPEVVNRLKLDYKVPLFVEIPDRHGTGRKPNFITDYVNEAIGLKL